MRQHHPDHITGAEARAQCLAFLYGCTPAKLAIITVAELVSRHKVREGWAEEELRQARRERGDG